MQTGEVQKVVDYTFGTDEISQTVETDDESGSSLRQTGQFMHDGHGSVRVLIVGCERPLGSRCGRLTGLRWWHQRESTEHKGGG